MKKYLACILVLTLMLALCACGGDSEPNGTEGEPAQSTDSSEGLEETIPVVEKVFTIDDLAITLTDDFEVYETDLTYYALMSGNAGIAFIKEEYSTFSDAGLNPDELTLADYAEGSISANNFTDSVVMEKDGITYFTYEATSYKYYSCVFRGADAFWRLNIYTYASDFDDMLPQFEQWAASVTFRYADLQNNLSSEKVVALNAVFHDSLTDGKMALSSDIQNNTDGGIQDLLIGFAAWDAEGNPVLIKGASSQSTESYIREISFSGETIAAGETWKAESEPDAVTGDTVVTGYMIDPSLTNICYVKTIVISCTLEDGTTWENPYYDEWVDTFGGVALESWMME